MFYLLVVMQTGKTSVRKISRRDLYFPQIPSYNLMPLNLKALATPMTQTPHSLELSTLTNEYVMHLL